jgi:hypothetical protein
MMLKMRGGSGGLYSAVARRIFALAFSGGVAG